MRKQLQKLLHNNNNQRYAPRFAEAKQIGILFDANNQDMEKPLANLIRQLEKEGKSVVPFTYFEGERQAAFQFPYEAFTSSDIDWLGNVRSEKVHKFMGKKFDFLFCFQETANEVIDLILAGSQAKCRVGIYQQGRENFYELMLIPEPNAKQEQMVALALQYTKTICQN